MIKIGEILKNMRKTAKLTQIELGEKINMADTTISSYERGNTQPDFKTINKIAKVCGYKFILKNKKEEIISLEDFSKEKDY